MFKCPRCAAKLVEHEPCARWRRWFECVECCSSWTLIVQKRKRPCTVNTAAYYYETVSTLVAGRNERVASMPSWQ